VWYWKWMSMARLGSRPGPPEPRSPGFTHWPLIAAAGVGVAALLAYLFTMYPDIAGGTAARSLRPSPQVRHPPPGYPLYSLLGKLFVHLPCGRSPGDWA